MLKVSKSLCHLRVRMMRFWTVGISGGPLKPLISLLLLLSISACAGPRANVVPFKDDVAGYERVAGIGNRVLQTMDPKRAGEYRVGIVASPSKNAWTTGSDLTVFFTRGALEWFDDSELTFIFAHEVAHVTLGHVESRQTASTVTSVVFTAIGAVIPGAGLLNVVANPLVTNAYSRPQEIEADKLAVESIWRCCALEKQVAIGTHEKLRAMSGNTTEEKRAGIWDTHPSLTERIERIKALPDHQNIPRYQGQGRQEGFGGFMRRPEPSGLLPRHSAL